MIDLQDLRERPEVYKKAAKDKGFSVDIDAFLGLDKEHRALKGEVEKLRARQNSVSKELPQLKETEKDDKLAEMKEVAAVLKDKAKILKELEERWERDQLFIPSIPLSRVVVGKGEADNVEVKRWGKIPEFSFTAKDHVELGLGLDILDIERGAKISGTRNYFLKGAGVQLQHAVLQLAMDLLTERGYTIFEPPHIVKYRAMMGTSYFPGGEEQAYHLDERDSEFYLIGTAEVPVTAYHMDEILPLSELPKRYAGYSPCYRREAGTYGKDTHGIYRIHQFYKVEQVVVCEADETKSAAFHAEMLKNSEDVLQLLELPYRVVDACTGELGRGQVFKNDIETWMPSRKGYGETHSCSTFHDFQARRLGLRYKTEQGKNVHCHTLNNTCVASPRILIPLLEVHQGSDGSILIPKAIRPYMGGRERIARR